MTDGNYADLRALRCIIDNGSFVGAARELRVSRSALSETIRRLEQKLGTQLLNRTTRSVSPTPAGARLSSRFSEASAEIEAAIAEARAASGEAAGHVRVHAQRLGYDLFLRPFLAGFAERFPKITLDIQIDDAAIDIASNGFDAAIRLGELVERDVIAFPLHSELRQIAVAAPGYLAKHGVPQHPRDLREHLCICFRWPGHATLYSWEFYERGSWFSVPVSGPLVINDQRATIDAAAAGAGIAFWVESEIQPYLNDGRLVALLTDYAAGFPGFMLYYLPQRHRSAAATAFIAAVRESVKPR
ncbi:LysR family transcriptional regulator [Acidocella facilis]|uniref:LysR family transcriptional regulator n=1 Tax=Acidocella facilis TaxID=525 RepID=UPI001F2CE920|nr:LysR family transcriptional regulator [Acidocella facilis]